MKKEFIKAGLLIVCLQAGVAFSSFAYPATEFPPEVSQSAKVTIRGKVIGEKGEILPGVTVRIKGTTQGTSTDASGNFTIQASSYKEILVFSYIGYLQVEQEGREQMSVLLPEDSHSLTEVVVSTQKRAQSSVEIPVAVSALSGANLKKLNLQQFDEMAQYIPGLEIQLQSPNNPGYVIRGVTSDDGDSRAQPRISVFQDGVSISRSRASVVELYDLERVEVVKGPQGTLFGRGAEIGAIHVIRNKPVDYLTGELSLGYGTHNQKLASGFINTPLSNNVANRFTFSYDQRDGFIDNLSGGKLNGKNTVAFRNSTRWSVQDATTVDLVVDYQYDNYPGTSFKSKRYAPAGGDTDPNTFADLEEGKNLYIKRHVGGALFNVEHRLNERWKLSSISGFRSFYSDESFDADGTPAPLLWCSEVAKGNQLSQEFRFSYDNEDRFSGFAGASYFYENSQQKVPLRTNEQSLYLAYVSPLLKEQFGAQFSQMGLPADMTGPILEMLFPDIPAVINGVPQYATHLPEIRQTLEGIFSQQLGVPVILEQALAGLGMSAESIASLTAQVDALSGQPINDFHEETYTNYGVNQAFEVFGDGTYKITDKLSVTAGLRLSYEHQMGGYRSDASEQPSLFGMLINGSPNLMCAVSDGKITATENYLSCVGRVALNYMFARNNAYVSFSRGRRPGVVLVLPEEVTKLKPEIIYSYEAGLKGMVAQGKLGYDFSVYYYDWSHFQTTTLQTVAGTLAPQYLADDAGKAHTFGWEASLSYSPVCMVRMFGNYSYIDGKFNQKDENGNEQEYAGNQFRLTPKHAFSLGLDVNIPVKRDAGVYIRPSYSYKSKVFFEDNNREDLTQDGYGLANFTAGLQVNKGNFYYEIGAFGKNVFDTKYMIDAGNSGDTIGFPTFIGGSRSVFGVQFKIGFQPN